MKSIIIFYFYLYSWISVFISFLCSFLFSFIFIFSSRLEQGRDSGSLGPWQQPRLRASRLCGAPHCTDQGSAQRGLSPARAQPSTGSHQRGLNMQQKHHLRQQHPLQVHRWAFLLACLFVWQCSLRLQLLLWCRQCSLQLLAWLVENLNNEKNKQ